MGGLALLLIREPKRAKTEPKKETIDEVETLPDHDDNLLEGTVEKKKNVFLQLFGALSMLLKNKVTRYNTMGSMFRYMSNVGMNYYQPIFFLSVYPQFDAHYGMAIATLVLAAGMISTLAGGIIGDKIASKNRLNLSRICYIGAIIASPFIILSSLITHNFYLAISCVVIRVLIAESCWGPSMSMIQQSVPKNDLSKYVSAWQFFNYLSASFITLFIGGLVNYLGFGNNQVALGKLLSTISFFTYLGSTLSWWKAGKEFKKLQDQKDNGKGMQIA